MTLSCLKCQSPNRDGARFCDNCGEPIGAIQEGQKRHVELRHGTLVYCDLVQSTELANRLDIEDLRLVFKAFYLCVDEVCKRHRGFLIRFVGDGAVMSFAFPVVLENAAESAIRAALQLTSEIRQATPVPGVDLNLRVGIASGTVAVGDLTNEAALKEEAIFGLVPHLAARLMASAAPGSIVIDDATHRMAGRFFEYRDLDFVQLKGFAVPERAWQVEAEAAVDSRYDARGGNAKAPLVGREDQLKTATRCWMAVREFRGTLLEITGEPGVGKSRLARELRAICVRDGAAVFELNFMEWATNTPLHPVGLMLRRLAGIEAGDLAVDRHARARRLLSNVLEESQLDDAANCLAPMFGLVTHLDAAEGQTADSMRERTISLLVDIVHRHARRRPVMLFCEDLHWSDDTTLQVLRNLCGSITERPIFVVATSRVPDLLSGPSVGASSQILLEPLAPDDARTLVHAVMRDREPSQQEVDEIVRLGGGVPLFIEELARYASGAVLDRSPLHHNPVGRATQAMTRMILEIMQPRVDRLGGLKPVAQAAAVIGREFQLNQLSELLPIGSTALNEALALLMELGLVENAPGQQPGYLRFRHALIQEAVHETILRSEQKRLHLDVVRGLERNQGEFDSTPDLVAHHLSKAEQFEAAAQHFLQAAVTTGARAAYKESAAHSLAGIAQLDLLVGENAPRMLRLQLTTQLAIAMAATKGYAAPETEQAYEAARSLCGLDADPVVMFPIVRGLASFYQVRCDLRATDDLCVQGVRLAEQSGRADFMIDVLAVQGYNHIYRGLLAAGRNALERCIAMYEQFNGRSLTYSSAQDPANAAWSELAIVAWLQGDTVASERYVERALAHADALARPFDVAYATCHAAALRNLQRRFAEANEHATRCVAISGKHEFKVWLVCGLMQSGVALSSMSNDPEPMLRLAATLDAFRGFGAELNVPYFMWGLARGQARLGDHASARETAGVALKRAELTGESWCTAELLLLTADLEESEQRAHELRQQAWEIAEAVGATTLMLRAQLALGHGPSALHPVLEGEAPHPVEEDWVVSATRALRRPATA